MTYEVLAVRFGVRGRFVERIRWFCGSRFVFLDEFGSNPAMTQRYARGNNGKGVRRFAITNYEPNVSDLAELRQGRIEACDASRRHQIWRGILRILLVPMLKQCDIVVMDNLAAHKVDGVHQLNTSAGARLFYPSPYSPDYSPIELGFAKL